MAIVSCDKAIFVEYTPETSTLYEIKGSDKEIYFSYPVKSSIINFLLTFSSSSRATSIDEISLGLRA